MRILKVAQVSRYFQPKAGGQETFIEYLNITFKKNQIDSVVFQPLYHDAKPKENVVYIRSLPLTYRIFKALGLSDWFLFNFNLKRNFSAIKKYDIIISHYSFHYSIFRKCQKLIVVSHGVLWSSQMNTLFDRYLYKQDKKLGKDKNVFIVACDTHFIRSIGYDIGSAECYFEEVFPNVWFIPNCVDVKRFCPNENESEKEKIILVPRNIRPDRGTHLAIEAFCEFNKIVPDYKMLIVGIGQGTYYRRCVQLVKEGNMEKSIIFVGHVNYDEMVNYYRKAKVTLIPTIEKEGTSFAALESMACGTPVVATKVAGLLDIPCAKADVNALSIAIALKEVLLGDYSQIAEEQREIVHKIFNIENWSKAWMRVISKVAEA